MFELQKGVGDEIAMEEANRVMHDDDPEWGDNNGCKGTVCGAAARGTRSRPLEEARAAQVVMIPA